MALKALMLRKKINGKKKELEALLEKDALFVTREAELEQSISEAETDEEHAAVEEAIEAYENDKKDHEEKEQALEAEIAGLESELAATEAEQERTVPTPEEAQHAAPEEPKEERGKYNVMNKRSIFAGMSVQERTAMFESEAVKGWLGEVRAMIREKRTLQNVGLTIPEEFLGLLRENILNYSKLYRHANVRSVSGEARQVIMGTVPEAIWTDCCANLNELDLGFADAEFYCWKVGGFFAVCNANIEDSDIDLAAELLSAIGQAIGMALDKAILYGTGNKMPLGVVTRLLQTSQPASYPATARAWEDLHTTNVKTLSATAGAAMIAEIVLDSGAAKGKYSRGEKVWCMNETTYTKLMAATVSVDAAGRIVSGVSDRMPVVGGIIEVLNFIPDNVIIGGYFDLYTLAERAGQKFATSEHVKFIQDQTVLKGTARYDGQPVIAEAFVALALNGSSVSSIEFAEDLANSAGGLILSKSAVSVAKNSTTKLVATTIPEGLAVTWTSADTSKATVDNTGKVTGVATGTTTITAASGRANAFCTVTVTAA